MPLRSHGDTQYAYGQETQLSGSKSIPYFDGDMCVDCLAQPDVSRTPNLSASLLRSLYVGLPTHYNM